MPKKSYYIAYNRKYTAEILFSPGPYCIKPANYRNKGKFSINKISLTPKFKSETKIQTNTYVKVSLYTKERKELKLIAEVILVVNIFTGYEDNSTYIEYDIPITAPYISGKQKIYIEFKPSNKNLRATGFIKIHCNYLAEIGAKNG